jgi:hypothetical protein
MAAIQPRPLVADIPPDCVAFAAAEAARDANAVGLFFRALGLTASPEKPIPMPASFLLQLGAALRLLRWESQGFFYHRQAGLPEAREAIRGVLLAVRHSGSDATECCLGVLRLSVERFAWSRGDASAGDVAVDDLTDDAALDALAEYLWAACHAERTDRPRS